MSTAYHLTAGSTISSSPAPNGAPGTTLEEPLTGTFTVTLQHQAGPLCSPNTLLCLAVASINLQSAHVSIMGSATSFFPGAFGTIMETTFDPELISVDLATSIGGQQIFLGGIAAFDANSTYPPPLNGIEICGAPPGIGGSCADIRAGNEVGYDLIINAALEQ